MHVYALMNAGICGKQKEDMRCLGIPGSCELPEVGILKPSQFIVTVQMG